MNFLYKAEDLLRRAWLPALRPKIVPVRRSGRNIMSGPAGLTESSRTSTLQPTVFHVILLLFTPSAHLHKKQIHGQFVSWKICYFGTMCELLFQRD